MTLRGELVFRIGGGCSVLLAGFESAGALIHRIPNLLMRRLILSLFVTLSLSALSFTAAAALPVNDGDLFLGFRASGGPGATQDYLVNIGSAANYTGAGAAFKITSLGNIGADLSAVFGSDWSTRGDVFWSVSGTNLPADAAYTLYATRSRTNVSNPATPWLRRSPSAQSATDSKFDALALRYQTLGVAASSPVGTIQNTTDTNSYASYQPGGTSENSGGISFGSFNPSVEGNFGGASGSVLDLFKIESSTATGLPSTWVGSFTISASGQLTFTPASVTTSAVAFDSAQVSVPENIAGGKASVKITRTGDFTKAFSIPFSTADGSAKSADGDYTAQTNTPVAFLAGQIEAFAEVPIGRAGFQGDRQFSVSLGAPPTNVTVGAPSTATVTIVENEANPSGTIAFSAATYAFPNLNGAGTPNLLAITLARSGGTTGAVTVDAIVAGGSLTNGTEFTFTNPTPISFAAGATTATVNIQLNAISAGLPGTISLSLGNPTGGANVGLQSTAVVTVGQFGTLAFSSSTYQITEPGTSTAQLQITVNRSGGSSGAVGVTVAAISGGTASSPADFTGTPTALSWGDTETGPKSFNIAVKADAVSEPAGETILLALQDVTGGAGLGTLAAATATINDGDAVPPALTLVTPKVNAKITAANVTFAGKATDNLNVDRVEIALNGGAPVVVTPASATTSFDYTKTLTVEQGVNTAVVTAYDSQNNPSTSITRKFTFNNLRPLLGGKYNGLITATANGAVADHSGLIAVTVTKTGTFTGKATLNGLVVPLTGLFLSGDGTLAEARFGKTKDASLPLLKKGQPANTSRGSLTLVLDTNGGNKITGAVANGANTVANIPHADQALYNKKTNPVPTTVLNPAAEKGKYTALFLAQAAPNHSVAKEDFPQGAGYGTVTVSAAGTAKVVGVLADGSKVSYTNALSKNNDWPVFVALYGSKGFVTGNAVFNPMPVRSDADAAGDNFLWVKPGGLAKQKLYPGGWPGSITTDFVASKFIAPKTPANAGTVLGAGVPSGSNLTIVTAEGGLTTTAGVATSNDATIDANSKVTVGAASAGLTGANTLKTSLAAKTGALSGGFIHPATSKAVKFAGVAYQKTGTAAGFFIYLPPANVSGAPAAASGAVEVTKQ